MAGKRKRTPPKEGTRGEESGAARERVAFQMRMEADLHEKLSQQAAEAGISLTQLVHGICEACSQNLIFGAPEFPGEGLVTAKRKARAVFFGKLSRIPDEDEIREAYETMRARIGPTTGRFWFSLDLNPAPIRTADDYGQT